MPLPMSKPATEATANQFINNNTKNDDSDSDKSHESKHDDMNDINQDKIHGKTNNNIERPHNPYKTTTRQQPTTSNHSQPNNKREAYNLINQERIDINEIRRETQEWRQRANIEWNAVFNNTRHNVPEQHNTTPIETTTVQQTMMPREGNVPAGDNMTTGGDNNNFRVYFQNVNGISSERKRTGKCENIIYTMNTNKVSIVDLDLLRQIWNGIMTNSNPDTKRNFAGCADTQT